MRFTVIIIRQAYLCLISVFFLPGNSYSQASLDVITEKDSREILGFLSSDRLKGRVNYSSGQIRAAEYIGQQFAKSGLQPFLKAPGFYHPFAPTGNLGPVSPNVVVWNGTALPRKQYYYSYPLPEVLPMQLTDFRTVAVTRLINADTLSGFINDSLPLLVWWPLKADEGSLKSLKQKLEAVHHKRLLIVFNTAAPETLAIIGDKSSLSRILYNVAAVLPGKSLADELVIICAHYDHVSTDQDGKQGLYNGANDNASGVTAVLQLAKYFSLAGSQERSILFVAFAGEELGMKGSNAFAAKIKPSRVVCVINIEMIGNHKEEYRNSFFITGEPYSDLAGIIDANLKGTGVIKASETRLRPDLFMRSDNFPFYLKGIPAHSFMSSSDDDPCYHRQCDDAQWIDYSNMNNIIRGIAKGITTIVAGTATPSLKK